MRALRARGCDRQPKAALICAGAGVEGSGIAGFGDIQDKATSSRVRPKALPRRLGAMHLPQPTHLSLVVLAFMVLPFMLLPFMLLPC